MNKTFWKSPKDELREIVMAMLELAVQNGHAEIVTRSDGKEGYRLTPEGKRYLATLEVTKETESGNGK